MEEDWVKHSRYLCTLIKNVCEGKETSHNYLNVPRYVLANLAKDRYLNLYLNENDENWTSCVECDEITFNEKDLTFTYHSLYQKDSFMLYQLETKEAFDAIKELFDKSVL